MLTAVREAARGRAAGLHAVDNTRSKHLLGTTWGGSGGWNRRGSELEQHPRTDLETQKRLLHKVHTRFAVATAGRPPLIGIRCTLGQLDQVRGCLGAQRARRVAAIHATLARQRAVHGRRRASAVGTSSVARCACILCCCQAEGLTMIRCIHKRAASHYASPLAA